ncbi:MAG: hypothetical protein JHC54_16435 [Acinetobacter sp.]|nr:hypothetical protein [Acinetobacter sp.]
MSQHSDYIQSVGLATASALFPNEFEYYMMALELVTSDDKLIDYLVFPVMPESISRSEQKITSIKKTFSGIVVTGTASFVPIDFEIQGTFGRGLKILLGGSNYDFGAAKYSTRDGNFNRLSTLDSNRLKNAIFNSTIKTGYGVTKVLQSMIDKADTLDSNGQPLRLHFYNPAFGESYLVKVTRTNFSQNESQNNMFWRYSFSMTAIAPLDATFKAATSSLITGFGINILQQRANSLSKSLIKFLKTI